MYILINNRPFNIIDLKVFEINKLNRNLVSLCVHELKYLTVWQRDLINRFSERNIVTSEIGQYNDLQVKYGVDFREKPNIVSKSNYDDFTVFYFDSTKYHFIIHDNERAEISNPYDTLEEATEARDQVLKLVNKVYASLKRVEI